MIKFGTHLVLLRRNKCMAQNELAKKTNLEISQIYRIEKGKINTTLSTLKKIADASDVSLSDLMNY